jgi:hypothetical protein
MRFLWVGAACAVLYSCALQHQVVVRDCARDQSYARGAREASQGRALDLGFSHSCSPASRVDAIAAYRDGYDSVKPHPAEETASAELATGENAPASVEASAVLRGPAATAWVCEVEANSKIFTGVGATRDEALGSAKSTCGSHFQASYCNKSDCKQSL